MAHRGRMLIFLPPILLSGQPGRRLAAIPKSSRILSMAIKRKRKKGVKKIVRSRDPFWRLRRALGGNRVESGRDYRRPSARKTTRKEIDDG